MNPILSAVVVLGGIGAVCALILVIASKYMAVPVDERFEPIRACLPGANCGACGYAGCDGYAGAIVQGDEIKINKCIPGGEDTAVQLAEITGLALEEVEELKAIVRCRGDCEATFKLAEYRGSRTCSAAKLLFGSNGACRFGCIGFGDCEAVCPVKAIKVIGDVAKVNVSLCMGCGACARTCPQKIINIVPKDTTVYVKCSSTAKGPSVRKNCALGCLACGLCQKKCPTGAIKIENNLPVINYDECTGCGTCAAACPSKCLIVTPRL